MEAGLVEEDVMLLVVGLQQLARLLRAFSCEALDVELWLLRSLEINPGRRGHVRCYTTTRKASLRVCTLLRIESPDKAGA
jgi:hypothetical protein